MSNAVVNWVLDSGYSSQPDRSLEWISVLGRPASAVNVLLLLFCLTLKQTQDKEDDFVNRIPSPTIQVCVSREVLSNCCEVVLLIKEKDTLGSFKNVSIYFAIFCLDCLATSNNCGCVASLPYRVPRSQLGPKRIELDGKFPDRPFYLVNN